MTADIPEQATRSASPARWWENIPVSEPHLVVLAAAGLAQAIAPRRLPIGRRSRIVVGTPLTGGAVALAAWAVASASRAGVTVDRSNGLVTDGAFGLTRNPMYIAWTAALVGLSVLTRSPSLLVGACAAAAVVHRDVLREEIELERSFGDEYRLYRRSTPRYFFHAHRSPRALLTLATASDPTIAVATVSSARGEGGGCAPSDSRRAPKSEGMT